MNGKLKLCALVAAIVSVAGVCAGAAADNAGIGTAQKQIEACQFNQAMGTLRAAAASAPNDAQVQYWLMRAAYELQDFDAAIAAGEKAVQLDGGNSDTYYWLGRSYGRKADRESSLSYARKTKGAFENAARVGPSNVQARRALMEYLVEAPAFLAGGSKSKAREQIAAIAGLDKAEGHLAQATYWTEDEEWQKAAEEYGKALALKPKDADVYFEAAGFFLNRQDVTRAREAVEGAAAVSPGNAQLPYYRAAVLALEGKNLAEAEKLALAYLQGGCRKSGMASTAAGHTLLGSIYEKTSAREKAIEQYRKALQLNAKSKGAKEGLKRLGQRV